VSVAGVPFDLALSRLESARGPNVPDRCVQPPQRDAAPAAERPDSGPPAWLAPKDGRTVLAIRAHATALMQTTAA